MKAKVIKRFEDKYTKAIHVEGEDITISNERFEEINSTSLGIFLEPIEDEEEKLAKEKAEKQKEAEAKLKAELYARVEKLQLELPDGLTIKQVQEAVEEAEAKARVLAEKEAEEAKAKAKEEARVKSEEDKKKKLEE
jgi:hypothetical protein